MQNQQHVTTQPIDDGKEVNIKYSNVVNSSDENQKDELLRTVH